MERTTLWQKISGDGTPKKSLFTALVVGTVLVMINHGDTIVAGQLPPIIKVLLTYCVPYAVTTWGAILGKSAIEKHYHNEPDSVP